MNFFLTSEIKCITSSNQGTEETVNVEVSSGDLSFQGSVSYTFATASTPTVTTVTPTEVNNGDTVTIAGSNLDGATEVIIGNSNCTSIAATSTQITCTAGFNPGGLSYAIKVITPNGFSDENLSLTYALTLTIVSPDEGSTGGGTAITLTGSGFDPDFDNSNENKTNIEIKVCDNLCIIKDDVGSVTENSIICITPAANDTSADSTCSVVLTQTSGADEASVTASTTFNYKYSLSPLPPWFGLTAVTVGVRLYL